MFGRALRVCSVAALAPSIVAAAATSGEYPKARDSCNGWGRRVALASSEPPPAGASDMDGGGVRIFGGSAHPSLNKQVADYLKLPTGRILLSKFADGETRIQVRENVRDRTVYVVSPTISNDSLVELMLTISCLRRASAGYIVAVMPYFGYARQDRKHDREPIAAADIARMLEGGGQEAGVDRVTAVDLHSGQIQGFFYCPVDNIQPWSVAASYFAQELLDLLKANEKIVVVAAHENQVHRANMFVANFEKHRSDARAREQRKGDGNKLAEQPVALAVLARSRDHRGENVPYLVGDVEGATCIVIDDIVNTGSTISSAVRSLKENGAKKVYAFATHAVFDDRTVSVLNACKGLEFLLVTNSIPMHLTEPCDKLRRVSIAPLLGEAIKRLQDGRSLHQLVDEHHIPCPAVPCQDFPKVKLT